MPRIRTVKPELWQDEKFASLIRDARLVFIAMLNYADDYGVVKGSPVYLKSVLFPYDDNFRINDFRNCLDALVNARFLVPFEYNGERYLNIRSFCSHQKIDRPGKPTVPHQAMTSIMEALGYVKETASDRDGSHANYKWILAAATEKSVDLHEKNHAKNTQIEHSTNIRRILDEPSPLYREKEREKEEEENTLCAQAHTREDSEISFDRFWDAYGKKIDKASCHRTWKKLSKAVKQKIMAYLPMYVASTPNSQFRKNPKTFLDRQAWENEIVHNRIGENNGQERVVTDGRTRSVDYDEAQRAYESRIVLAQAFAHEDARRLDARADVRQEGPSGSTTIRILPSNAL